MAHVIADAANENLRLLRERLATIDDVYSAPSVLARDGQTYMPTGGVGERAEQLASLASLPHGMLVSPETGQHLEGTGNPEPDTELLANEGKLIRPRLS